MRQLIISGHLGKDPQMSATKSGEQMCRFRICSSYKKQGKDEDLWVAVTVMGKLADNCARSLHQGSWCLVSGTPSLESYTGRDGKFHTDLHVFAGNVEFGPMQSNNQQGYGQQPYGGYGQPPQQQYYAPPPQQMPPPPAYNNQPPPPQGQEGNANAAPPQQPPSQDDPNFTPF